MVATVNAYTPPLPPDEITPTPDQPVPQGPAPALNRAWPRRGYAAPWRPGLTIASIQMETTVQVERRSVVPNALGGFKTTGGWVSVFKGPCHAELVTNEVPAAADTESTLGATIFRHYELFAPLPADPAAMPQSGDRVTFSDGYEVHRLIIDHIELPDGLTDHWEASTNEFVS